MIQLLRWIARIWAIFIIAFGVLETLDPVVSRPTPWHEWLSPVLLFTGAGLGFILCWRWELVGGLMFVLSFVAAMIVACLSRGACLPLGVMATIALLFTTPGVLFIVCWGWQKRRTDDSRSKPSGTTALRKT
jgi:hypothetical protein